MTDRLANYEPVQTRLAKFWADFPDGRIDCEFLERDDQHVLALARIWRHDEDTFPASVGYAAEAHDGSPVNRQGWMIENAETSAIGRALANLGYAPTTARPSSEDMERATVRKKNDEAATDTYKRLLRAKGTDLADQLRALADEHGKELKASVFATDPQWRAQVNELLNGEE